MGAAAMEADLRDRSAEPSEGASTAARSEGKRPTYRLEDRYLADEGTVFLTGIQALARLPLEQLRADRRAGLRTAALVSGYPGSPLGGYDGAVAAAARLAQDLDVICRPAMNEEFGASAVMGSQLATSQPDARYDGVLGIWYGKAPGVDRASDALRHAVYAGSSETGGAVALVGDDPAAKSSTVPSSSAGTLADLSIPLLYPGDPEEALFLGRHAIAISRLTGLWSALKIVADVADATATVTLAPDSVQPKLPRVGGRAYRHSPDGNLLTPRTLDVEREIVEVRYPLAREYALLNGLNTVVVNPPDAFLGIVSSGITYREVRESFARLGLRSDESIKACGIRLLKMNMPMPFDPETVRRFAKGLGEVLVIEEKSPNLESLVKDALYGMTDRPRIVGKEDELGQRLMPAYGALDADVLVPILRRRFQERLGDRIRPAPESEPATSPPLSISRTPFYCSGCPHNRSTQVPKDSLVGAGIGCHTMALLMDKDRVGDIGGLGCMGNEGVQWIGMSPFLERDHFIQNLGDGTFFHSGQLAIQASIAAGVNVTYKLLYNGTVAMTGGQDPEGQLSVPEVARMLLGQGAARILITTDDLEKYDAVSLPAGAEVWSRTRLIEAQETLAAVPGTTVLIHDQGCAAEARRARKRGRAVTPPHRVVINHRLCEGCGDCGEISNCLSVQPFETPFGRKTRIDQTTCNLDYSCLEGDCPSFMTVTRAGPSLWQRLTGSTPEAPGSLPSGAPVAAVPPNDSKESPARPPSTPFPAPPDELPAPEWIVPHADFAMRITGIGGTGVVTVAQVLGTAAMLDGYHVRGLDQIGLSQKAGPVVSDLRLSRSQPTATNRLGEGQADLLLAFDQLVAASERGLRTTDPEKTAVVGSTTATPTGEMITHPERRLPSAADLVARIAKRTRPLAQFWTDAAATTEDLFGSTTTANLFVVGMAVQAGCFPVTPEAIESAIELNGVSVAANQAAFRWGRAQIVWPERVELARKEAVRIVHGHTAPDQEQAQIAAKPRAALERRRVSAWTADRCAALDLEPALRDMLHRYCDELIAWGSEKDAEAYLARLRRVLEAEEAIRPGERQLFRTVAAQSYRLIAYKDEYEVARLMTLEEGTAAAQEVAQPGDRIAWRLHPPILRALGLSKKIAIGPWATPLVRLLARGKGLRGTLFDPFRWAEVRQVERGLAAEYHAAIEACLPKIGEGHYAAVCALAALPDRVRGYEEIKLARVKAYRSALQAQRSAIESGEAGERPSSPSSPSSASSRRGDRPAS